MRTSTGGAQRLSSARSVWRPWIRCGVTTEVELKGTSQRSSKAISLISTRAKRFSLHSRPRTREPPWRLGTPTPVESQSLRIPAERLRTRGPSTWLWSFATTSNRPCERYCLNLPRGDELRRPVNVLSRHAATSAKVPKLGMRGAGTPPPQRESAFCPGRAPGSTQQGQACRAWVVAIGSALPQTTPPSYCTSRGARRY